MRPAWLATLVLLAVAAGVADAQGPSVRPGSTVKKMVLGSKKEPEISLDVVGKFEKEPEDAERAALQEAQARLFAYLRSLNPDAQWKPDLEYIRKNLVKRSDPDFKDFDDPVIGRMRQTVLRLEITAKDREDMQRRDRRYQAELRDQRRKQVAEQRMQGLAKVVGGLVTLLAGVAGYIRLDELTKGYYTTWLRLAAASFVAAVSAGLWLLV